GDVGCAEDELGGFPCGVLPRHLQLGEIQVRVTRPRLADRGERGARAIPVLALAELLFLPESDEKHALRRDAAYLVEHSRRACLALHVAGAQKLAKVTMRGLVEGLGGPGELARLVHADDDASAWQLLRRRNFCAKFHSALTKANV